MTSVEYNFMYFDRWKSKVRSMIDNYAVLREKEGETKDVSVSLLRVLYISRTVTQYYIIKISFKK